MRLARIERAREVRGVEGRRVDRLLQVHPAQHVVEQEAQLPLVLLVAAGRAERHDRRPSRSARLGDSVVRGRRRGRSVFGSPSCSQAICTRVPSGKPERRDRPATSAASRRSAWPRPGCRTGRPRSTWQVSPRVSPVRDTVGSDVVGVVLVRRAGAARPRSGRGRAAPGCARPACPGAAVVGASSPTSARRSSRSRPRAARPAAPRASRRTRPPGRRRRAWRTRRRCGRSRRVPGREVEPVQQRELLQQHRPLAPRAGLAHGQAARSRELTGAS